MLENIEKRFNEQKFVTWSWKDIVVQKRLQFGKFVSEEQFEFEHTKLCKFKGSSEFCTKNVRVIWSSVYCVCMFFFS